MWWLSTFAILHRIRSPRPGNPVPFRPPYRNHLDGSEVYDLAEVRRTMLDSHHGPAVSRAVHQLVRRGVLESMTPTSNGFLPAARGHREPGAVCAPWGR